MIFSSTDPNYYILSSDTTANRGKLLRVTNISTSASYTIFVRTVANNGSTNVASFAITPSTSIYIRKDPDHFLSGASSNIYVQPVAINS